MASKSIFFLKPKAAWQFAQENIAFSGRANQSVKLGRRLAGVCMLGFHAFCAACCCSAGYAGKNISGVGSIICEKLTVRLLWDLGLFALATAWQIARKKTGRENHFLELWRVVIAGFVSPVLGCLTGCRFTLALVVGWWGWQRSLGSFQLQQ